MKPAQKSLQLDPVEVIWYKLPQANQDLRSEFRIILPMLFNQDNHIGNILYIKPALPQAMCYLLGFFYLFLFFKQR